MSARGGASITVVPFNPFVTVDETTTITSGGGATDWVGRASIRRRPSDDALVMAYYRAEAHSTNKGALHIRFSDDHGATWTDEDETLAGGAVTGFPMNPAGSTQPPDAGEPQLYVCPNGDLLVHMWLVDYGVSTGGSWQSRSTDGGETWDTPDGPIQFAGLTSDQNNRTFSTDDEFVLGSTIYAAARVYIDATNAAGASVLITSDDNGATWTRLSTLVSAAHESGGGHETGLEYVGNQQIIAMIRDFPHTASYQIRSTDLGVSWGELTDVTAEVGIAARQRVYTLAHLRGEADWWEDPNLIMVGFVHQSSGSSHPRRSAVWLSPNRGADWDGPHYIDISAEDGGYGDVFYDPDNDQYVVVSYHGTLLAASLKQYRLTISGI